jgi:replicative DNA helicase
MAAGSKRPLSVFLCYAQKDEALKQEFEDYLAILQQNQLISGWVERPVQRGTDWSQTIDPRLLAADLILLMMSPSLLASGYCSGAEFREAFERNKTRRKAALLPISLYYVNLQGHPLEFIAFTPHKPVSSWPERHDAWRIVDRGIRHTIAHHFKA